MPRRQAVRSWEPILLGALAAVVRGAVQSCTGYKIQRRGCQDDSNKFSSVPWDHCFWMCIWFAPWPPCRILSGSGTLLRPAECGKCLALIRCCRHKVLEVWQFSLAVRVRTSWWLDACEAEAPVSDFKAWLGGHEREWLRPVKQLRFLRAQACAPATWSMGSVRDLIPAVHTECDLWRMASCHAVRLRASDAAKQRLHLSMWRARHSLPQKDEKHV